MQPVEVPAGLRDLAHERQRLTQQLNDRARYDPAALAQLAALCFEMHDLFHAGRLWLFSDATGDSVEPVVDYFADRCGRKPRSILSQVPAYVLQPDLETYPAVVRDRLARVGISESDLRGRITPPGQPTAVIALDTRGPEPAARLRAALLHPRSDGFVSIGVEFGPVDPVASSSIAPPLSSGRRGAPRPNSAAAQHVLYRPWWRQGPRVPAGSSAP